MNQTDRGSSPLCHVRDAALARVAARAAVLGMLLATLSWIAPPRLAGSARAGEEDAKPAPTGPPVNAYSAKDPFVREWILLGPFPTQTLDKPTAEGVTRSGYDTDFLKKLGGEAEAVLDQESRADSLVAPNGMATALRARTNVAQENRHLAHEPFDLHVGYGFAYVDSDAEREVVMVFRSDGSPKVWLNGELVAHGFHDKHRTGAYLYQEPVRLKKGRNRVLVKLDNKRRWWGFQLHLYPDEDARAEWRMRSKRAGAYKKWGHKPLRELDKLGAGQAKDAAALAKAKERALRILEIWPGDPDGYYCLAIAETAAGNLEAAMTAVRQGVAAGLPLERFLAGPRDLTKALVESEAFQEFAKGRAGALLHGPMLGDMTDTSVRIWLRTDTECEVRAIATPVAGLAEGETPVETKSARTRAEADYTATLRLEGLKPDTAYFYKIHVDGEAMDLRPQPSFTTFPVARTPATFRVVFGGGAGYTPRYERMWLTIRDLRPTALLLLGDNVYIDRPQQPSLQRYCYYRRQSQAEFRELVARTPVFSIWDDHDFAINDSHGGPAMDSFPWKAKVWEIFQQNWVNPPYAGGAETPGTFYAFRIADVEFFMLDGRMWRTDPEAATPEQPATMLGPAQRAWLKTSLKRSSATFKVIASPVPWAPGAKPHSKDTWDGFPEERKEIFDFLGKEGIEGVILMAADRHRSDAWKLEREGAYPLYEVMSSRLTNVHTHGIMPGSLFGYNELPSCGVLEFDTLREDPVVIYRIIDLNGNEQGRLRIKRSQLSDNR